ncbi:S8 family serine peptidase [Hymenobacter chitinivorans]|uniref:Putative secreted protein (Por secretion system target) n=1 Tax=Hymenobacter chitinivorans DSM 11115 TaxID=1121954 RepID=A0A2M9BR55_9BACT|nr:S8 family serine peptidase [Hymenobacter chitinivorans]PJJ60397.1 putative secreted protein (Por secretion system target) [Hymenobacter chitinivorans DSM 11115]
MRLSTLLLAGLSLGTLPTWAGSVGSRPGTPPAKAPGTVRKHLIYFRDKANTPFSPSQPQAFLSARALERRTRQNISVQARDLPVSPTYVSQVKAVPGAQLWYTSRWFNAAVVACDSTTLATLQALPFVRSVVTLNRSQSGARPASKLRTPVPAEPAQRATASPADYGPAYSQAEMIGAVAMHNANFRGEGIQIAVFDAGFPGVDKIPAFAPLFQEGRLASTFNFVDKTGSVFERNDHGTNCLSTIAGNQTGFFIGTAPKATFHLYLTEDIYSEHPVEEMNWLIAAEYADSVGVDVISSSLGYNTFDYPSKDYTYADLNGRTAISTRAAAAAARVGMLVVNSAGNEGANGWHYLTAPADADSILTVGAVDVARQPAGFSSFGPTADGRVKPNVAALGVQAAILTPSGAATRGNGTSFACPITAGMVAGFWQANRNLTAQQVISFLQRSGSRATTPDAQLGYGVPNFVLAYNLAHPNDPLATAEAASEQDKLLVYPNPAHSDELYLQLSPTFQNRPLTVRITDARGALVAEQKLPATAATQVALKPGPLRKGIYQCTLIGSNGQRTVRFVQL